MAREDRAAAQPLIMLLVPRHYVSKERHPRAITRRVPDDPRARGVREDVRARQGGPAQLGRPDRGRARIDTYFEDEPGYRIRADAFAAARDHAARPTRRPSSASRPGSGSTPRLAAATTEAVRKLTRAGRRGRPSRARHRPARGCAPRSRPSTCSGRPPRSAPRSSSSYRRSGAGEPRPGTSSRGASVRYVRALVRRRATTPTAARSGCSGSPGCRARCADGPAGVVRRPGRHRPRARSPHRLAPRTARHEPRPCCVRQRRRQWRCAAAPRDRGRTSPARTSARLGPRSSCPSAAATTLADELLGLRRRRRRRGAGRAARRGRRPAAAVGVRSGVRRMTGRARAREQVGRLLALVPYLQPAARSASTRPPRTSASMPAQLVKDLKVLFMCGLPGGYPRRPDRRRPRRARGRGRHPGRQRRLPGPSAPARSPPRRPR